MMAGLSTMTLVLAEQRRIAVGLRARDFAGRDRAAAAALVLDHDACRDAA